MGRQGDGEVGRWGDGETKANEHEVSSSGDGNAEFGCGDGRIYL